MTIEQKIDLANQQVMNAILNGQPVWVDVQPAGDVVPGMKKNLLLVAGPPIVVENIVGPVKTALCGAAIHEGLAADAQTAWAMIEKGEIEIASAQDHGCACGAAMAISASMPVIVAKDEVNGTYGFTTPHPGGATKVLRWGFYDESVEKDMCWFRDVYGPALGAAVRAMGGINIRSILAKTAGMGDENHNRQPAASMQLILQMIPALLDLKILERDEVIRALAANDRFFLHVMMAGAMCVITAAKNVPMSTVLVAMGGNGVEFGMQFSGTGSKWYTVPAPQILGQFLNTSWTKDDILGFLGDSCVTEVYGLGGFSAIAGPSYVRLSGATFEEARRRTEAARSVSLGEHAFAPVPWDNYRGFPVGVDMRKVVALNTVPTSHGGSTLKVGGQGGIGSAPLPIEGFRKALADFGAMLRSTNE